MTPATVRQVPNQPKTPLHSFRVDTDLWNAARDKARAEGTTIAEVLRAALANYVERK
jgi:hypothetical protein